ncbi:hypothetical protein COMA2_30143 [Candidatus Nitrospira nitrificans]|uniref:Uncharacterized protein n=1 Tax=Candidatus Nitrospira nitrificans TaxID=1742973 RepID=A0A0S4LJZ5_9BACT|nr:hypothetical protein COMA2_30143 [Candidatus Nitrospira nitrificans]
MALKRSLSYSMHDPPDLRFELEQGRCHPRRASGDNEEVGETTDLQLVPFVISYWLWSHVWKQGLPATAAIRSLWQKAP